MRMYVNKKTMKYLVVKKIPTFASQSKIKEIAKRGVAQSG